MFWFPRYCPRGCVWPVSTTTAADRERFFGHGDGTTTATSPDGRRILHSHSPPPGQDTLWADPPAHGPPATAA